MNIDRFNEILRVMKDRGDVIKYIHLLARALWYVVDSLGEDAGEALEIFMSTERPDIAHGDDVKPTGYRAARKTPLRILPVIQRLSDTIKGEQADGRV